MQFSFAVRQLNDSVRKTVRGLETCRSLYASEGIDQPALKDTMDVVSKELSALGEAMAGILAANERTFDIVEFLTKAMAMEHATIAELQSYVAAVPDPELTEKLAELLFEEKKHEEALARQIRELGGQPRITYAAADRSEPVSIVDLLRKHREVEVRTRQHYEAGLSRFEEPEFQWIIGKLKIEEQQHIDALDALIETLLEKYTSADVIPEELKHIKWTDPYMGERGDRPWIE